MHRYSCDGSGIKAEPAESSAATKGSFLSRKKKKKEKKRKIKSLQPIVLSPGSKHAVRLNKIIARKKRSYNPLLSPKEYIVVARGCVCVYVCMCVCEVYCPGHVRLTTPLTGSQSNPVATITSILALEAIMFQHTALEKVRRGEAAAVEWLERWEGVTELNHPASSRQPHPDHTHTHTHTHTPTRLQHAPLSCLAGVDWGHLSALVRPSQSTHTCTQLCFNHFWGCYIDLHSFPRALP